MRWLYHLARRSELAGGQGDDGAYVSSRFASERFIHASFRDTVIESRRIDFPGDDDAEIAVLQIDPRRLDILVELANTPRGPMPHIHGAIPRDAIRATLAFAEIEATPDRVTGTRIACVAFEGMKLLDLVGVYEALSRIRSMGFDPTSITEIIAADRRHPWSKDGARIEVERVRPSLDELDVLVFAGELATTHLAGDRDVVDWIASFPKNRIFSSVCTGGATRGIELGLQLVERLEGRDVAAKIAAQMEWQIPGP